MEDTLVEKDEDKKKAALLAASLVAGAAAGGIVAAVMLQDERSLPANIQELAEEDMAHLKKSARDSYEKERDFDADDMFYDNESTIAASEAPTSLLYGSTLLGHDEEDSYKIPHRFSGLKYGDEHEYDHAPRKPRTREAREEFGSGAVGVGEPAEEDASTGFSKGGKAKKTKKGKKGVSWEVEGEKPDITTATTQQ